MNLRRKVSSVKWLFVCSIQGRWRGLRIFVEILSYSDFSRKVARPIGRRDHGYVTRSWFTWPAASMTSGWLDPGDKTRVWSLLVLHNNSTDFVVSHRAAEFRDRGGTERLCVLTIQMANPTPICIAATLSSARNESVRLISDLVHRSWSTV